MSNEWKMVPVDLLRRLIAATKLARGHGSPTQLQAELILKAPVPPAGDVEVLGYIVTDMNGDSYLAFDRQTPTDRELVDRAHFTRLTAERDGLLAEVQRLRKVVNFEDAVACVFDNLKFAAANTGSKEWDDQLEDLAEEVIEYAPNYKKQWKDICVLQSELTKARELLTEISVPGSNWQKRVDKLLAHQSASAAKYDCCANCMRPKAEHAGTRCPSPYTTVWNAWDYGFAPAAKCSICNGTGVVGDASIGYDHCFHSAAPAAKGGESGETICLLCFDKKTVPGPKHGDFVRDCPECCGEEG